MRRNLDGIYFRIGAENICFSDLTEDQMYQVMNNKSDAWLKSLAVKLALTIKDIGEALDIIGNDPEEKEQGEE